MNLKDKIVEKKIKLTEEQPENITIRTYSTETHLSKFQSHKTQTDEVGKKESIQI